MRLMITGGGTGGHVYPGIAVAREIKRRNPADEVLFVGAKRGVETKLVPAEGFEIVTLEVEGLKGRGFIAKVFSFARFVRAVRGALAALADFRPDVVLGVGGYASGPACLAAVITRTPLALAEQNVAPGMTNRWLKRFARRVFVTWPGSEKSFPEGVATLTGNPVRPEFFSAKKRAKSERVCVLVIGGSQGAASINRAMAEAAAKLAGMADSISIVHQTGAADLAMIEKAYAGLEFLWEARAFFDDMAQRIADADLVVSRAGAGAVAEICAVGRAAVYVPFPRAADDHQTKNAQAMVEAGAALMVRDADFTGEKAYLLIKKLAHDKDGLERMGRKAKTLARPEAAAKIADGLLLIAREKEAA